MGIDIANIEVISTVGELMVARKWMEICEHEQRAWRPDNPRDEEAKATGRKFYLRMLGVVEKSPGVADLQMLCSRDGVEWSSDWLRKHRGIVAADRQLSAAEIDAMPVVDFAKNLTGVGKPPGDASRLSVNDRMKAKLLEDSNVADWTIRQWKEYMGASTSTIQQTPVWKEIMRQREADKWDRRL